MQDLQSPSVTFTLSYNEEDYSEGNKLDTESAIRKRLDALDVPYAIGTVKKGGLDNEYAAYVIKTELSRMGLPVMSMLRSTDFVVSTKTSSDDRWLSLSHISVEKSEEKNELILHFNSLYDYDKESLQALAEEALNNASSVS